MGSFDIVKSLLTAFYIRFYLSTVQEIKLQDLPNILVTHTALEKSSQS